MTEPVGYLVHYVNGDTDISKHEKIGHGVYSTPLYASKHLHQRVKMTQTQYKEWQQVINSIYPVNLYELFNLIFNPAEHKGEYAGMRDIFSFDEGQKKLARLWSDYNPDDPEETIEIVPDMKWFVRSKKKDATDGDFEYLSKFHLSGVPSYRPTKRIAAYFNTKEQAELWTNPLTEAVQLPVEDS